MTTREIVYMVLDLAKANTSDDSFFTEDHVLFLLKKYRSFLLKKEYDKKQSSTSNTDLEYECQQIVVGLEKANAGICGSQSLKTTIKIPKMLDGAQPRIYPSDYYQGANVCYVPREKMKYIGTNKYLRNILYASIGPDQCLYLKGNNAQFMYMKKIRISAVFEDMDAVTELLCDKEGNQVSCDVLDEDFPIREYLVPQLIELVVKELVGAIYKPQDERNNASDDLSKTALRSQS